MAEISGFPYFEAQFTKKGKPVDPAEPEAVLAAARARRIDDLVVVSHGWNNDMADARTLYRALFEQVRGALDAGAAPGLAGRRIAVLGVLWPSKKFADDDLIPGGAASFGDAVEGQDVQRRLEDLKGTFDRPDAAPLERAKQLVPHLEGDPRAQREFVNLIRSVLPRPEDTADDASDVFFDLPGDEVLRLLEPPVLPGGGAPGGGGGALGIGLMEEAAAPPVGGAAGIGDLFSGITAAARRLLNYATYYQMKERAGKIGAGSLNPLVREIKGAGADLKVHLVGHSFGGRLVAAAALGAPGSRAAGLASMTLLQAAFSHNGFALDFDGERDGFFREVVEKGKVAGPILITYTKNDRAVGIAYPLASRFARQDASDFGDQDDIYGGIGRNGAIHTPEAVRGELLPQGGQYSPLAAGKLYNLRADAFIKDHSDVAGPEVARAMLAALTA
ncbi:MAG: hypothetical protein ACREH6_10880 [Geminicoccaceae bacterium]